MRVIGRFIIFAEITALRDIPYSINFTGRDVNTEDSPFEDIRIEQEGDSRYIIAAYEGKPLRDRIGTIDGGRLDSGEITLADLAYKHFAYVLD